MKRSVPAGVAAPCWWLVRSVYLEELGIILPERGVFAPKPMWAALIQQGMRSGEWRRVPDPADFDVALLAANGIPRHVGVVAEGQLLHAASARAGVSLRPLSRCAPRLWGYFRLAAPS